MAADVIVWPESAVPALENEMQEFLANWRCHARASHRLTGIQYLDMSQRRFYNGVIGMGQIDEAGVPGSYQYAQGNRYYKRHLVPIGEFVPFGELLRPIAPFFNLPMFAQPRRRGAGEHPGAGPPLSTAICYEDGLLR